MAGGTPQRTAIVTGGTRGIGRAVVERLAAGGARVVACGRDEARGARLEAELGDAVAFRRADVASEAEVEALVAFCAERFGPPGVLVNNAGIMGSFDATRMTGEEWDDFFAVSVKSAWTAAKHALPHMIAAGGGAIVNLSSIHAFATSPGRFPYSTAKAALIGLTRNLALDHGPHGVRVNAVCPGFTRTDMVEDHLAGHDDPAAAERELVRGVALGRLATSEEVAAAVAFLASDEASFITGTTLLVDGGLTARRGG